MRKVSRAVQLHIQQRAAEQNAQVVAKLVGSGHRVQTMHDSTDVSLKSYLAYRVRSGNGTLVLCRTHLEQHRITMEPAAVKLTGETFAAGLCDHCHPERS